MTKPYILLLGASQDQRFIIRTARGMGIGTAVVDANPASVSFPEADISQAISTKNVAAIIRFAEQLLKDGVNLCGVSVMGSDIPQIVSEIARHFGWPGPTEKTAHLATHKFAMKNQLQKADIPIPRFARVNSPAEVISQWQKWGVDRVVTKPVDCAGSRGVWILHAEDMAAAAFANAYTNSPLKTVMVEEFIPGPQISTESILTESKSCTPGLVDRYYEQTECYLPQIIENGGWYPSELGKQIGDMVSELTENAGRALGITRGVAKGDIVVCPERGPMVIEIAARLSGGDFSESLIPIGCGVNYVEAVLAIAIGREPDWRALEPKFEKTVANRYFFVPPGKLNQIEGLDQAAGWSGVSKIEIFKTPGQTLPDICAHGQRTGVFIIYADNRKAAEDLIRKVYERVRFRVDNKWVSGVPGRDALQ